MASSRIWFITGSSSGLGRQMVETALVNGERVVATLRTPEAISDLGAKYTEDQLLILKLDVSKRDEVASAFDTAKEAFGRIDIVFSNAGTGIMDEVESTPEELARWQFEVNFWGGWYVTVEAMKCFRETNIPIGGKLMHMSSMYGVDTCPGGGWYCATKFAAEAMVESLSKELDPAWNIKIVVLCPGYFKTPMNTNAHIREPLPAYASNPQLPTNLGRKALREGQVPTGDPVKLINRIFELSKTDEHLLHVPLGVDAVGLFEGKAKTLSCAAVGGVKWSEDLTF
ncbi:NAD(P)-binding protein [Rhodocollybia butyracea]|uniref:NAD(P)-binding protein n=1 Tax=Rhodocollybia butyracea TaxID=206335 RepID=A0A9P5U6W9_9AGAR|nr:NAD(P)-binding protein [Rhodocollybia butyracea]